MKKVPYVLLPLMLAASGCVGALQGANPFQTGGPVVPQFVSRFTVATTTGANVAHLSIVAHPDLFPGVTLACPAIAVNLADCAFTQGNGTGFSADVVGDGFALQTVRGVIGQPVSVTLKPSHFDPTLLTDAQKRAVRGSLVFWLPELKPQCPEDPVTHIRCVSSDGATPHGVEQGWFWTANYRLYPADQRATARAAYKALGYTHWTLSLFCSTEPDYHGIFPDCATHAQVGLNDALHELLDDGLIPIGFVTGDYEPDDLATPIEAVTSGVDPSLVPLGSPGWEHLFVDCKMQKVRAAFPNMLLYYHNPTNTDAGYPDDCYGHNSDAEYTALGGGEGWWRHAQQAYGVRGAFVQTAPTDDAGIVDRLADFTSRMQGGFHGWPTDLDVVHFEDLATVYNTFWGGADPQANLAHADAILIYLHTPLCAADARMPQCGALAGFGSGGTAR